MLASQDSDGRFVDASQWFFVQHYAMIKRYLDSVDAPLSLSEAPAFTAISNRAHSFSNYRVGSVIGSLNEWNRMLYSFIVRMAMGDAQRSALTLLGPVESAGSQNEKAHR